MAINYIQNADGTGNVAAASKIKDNYINQSKVNPFLLIRLLPFNSEGFKTGGGNYTFRTPLGINEAVRRSTAPTSSTVTYNGNRKLSQVLMTVLEPFETDKFAFQTSDAIQLDGMDYSPMTANDVTSSLVKAEIINDAKLLNTDPGRTLLSITATTAIDKIKGIKEGISAFYDISNTNTVWENSSFTDGAVPAKSIKAYDYFIGQTNGSYNKDELTVFMHPKTFMELSNAVTEAGAGSDMQYQEFVTGSIPMIGGVKIVVSNFVDQDKVIISPINQIGVPDPDVMSLNVIDYIDSGNNLRVVWGQHYFDSILVTPPLVMEVSFSATKKK